MAQDGAGELREEALDQVEPGAVLGREKAGKDLLQPFSLLGRYRIIDLWRRSLHRRSQKDRTNWERITKLVNDFLPRVRILHPWPLARFAVTHPRWEPSARIGPARICAGSAQ